MTDLPNLKDLREKIREKIFHWALEEGGDKLHFNELIDEVFAGFESIVKAHAEAHRKDILYYDCAQTVKATAALGAVLALAPQIKLKEAEKNASALPS